MRVVLIVALFVFGVAAANAADLVRGGRDYSHHRPHGKHATAIVVYDWQPGVFMRAYWRKPWRNRHYFPTTGTAPEQGRDEDLTAPRERPEPADDFRRSWTTTSVFAEDDALRPRLMPAQDPRAEDMPQLPQLPQSQIPQTVRP